MNERKIRKDFDSSKKYTVNVSDCTNEEKKEVQQAFFDVGILWDNCGGAYQLLNALQYTNATSSGNITTRLMFAYTPEGCNMSAEEFLELVYEPEQQGHIHAELMAQFAEDAKTHAEPWKLWQFRSTRSRWLAESEWFELRESPSWVSELEYRRKPKTKIVHGVEVPDIGLDLSKCEKRTDFYAPCVRSYKYYVGLSHSKQNDCTRFSQNGIAYPYTEEGKQAAILHAKAMLGLFE